MAARNPQERHEIASIAALTRSTRENGADRMEAAHAAYRDTFYVRHECDRCGTVEIDQALPPEEITKRGDAAYKVHMRRLALGRERGRREAEEHEAAAVEARQAAEAADAELADIASAS